MKTLIILLITTVASFGATHVTDSFLIYSGGTNKLFPAVSGNNVSWRDDNVGAIYNYNLSSGEYKRLGDARSSTGTDSSAEVGPNMGGNYVVWSHGGNIHAYNLSTSTSSILGPDNWGAYSGTPKTDGQTVVWQNNGYAWVHNLSSGTTITVGDGNQYRPDVDGKIVVWQTGDIYGYNLNTNSQFPINTQSGYQGRPGISGDYVVSQVDYTNIIVNVLSTGETFNVNSPISGFRDFCAIDGQFVVWEDARNGDFDIYGYNLLTREEFVVYEGPGNQQWPAINNGLVVWSDYRPDGNGYAQIYGAYVPEPSVISLLTGFVLLISLKRRR